MQNLMFQVIACIPALSYFCNSTVSYSQWLCKQKASSYKSCQSIGQNEITTCSRLKTCCAHVSCHKVHCNLPYMWQEGDTLFHLPQ